MIEATSQLQLASMALCEKFELFYLNILLGAMEIRSRTLGLPFILTNFLIRETAEPYKFLADRGCDELLERGGSKILALP